MRSGWFRLLPLMGARLCYTGLPLKRCIDSLPLIETYPDIGQAAAFGVAIVRSRTRLTVAARQGDMPDYDLSSSVHQDFQEIFSLIGDKRLHARKA